MSYNSVAETFSRSARVPFVDLAAAHRGVSFPPAWSKFDQLYSEIADATDTEAAFRTGDLLVPGALPCIDHLAPKTRRDIVQVVLRDMLTLPADADGLTRVFYGCYRWRFAAREAVA